nr:YdcF family protein [Propylenella binzhouense]
MAAADDLGDGRVSATAGPRAPLFAAGIRIGATLFLLAFSAFVGGFLVFADQVVNSREPARPHADGIVALTGGPQRIADAVALLQRGSADRLLISGVYERTSADALADRTPELASLLGCCVDIGYSARNTKGNAREAGEWARQRGYDSLIVVTSAYHMPRSLAEMSRELPRVRLVPFPVQSERLAHWYSDPATFRLLLVEYTKYIVARLT